MNQQYSRKQLMKMLDDLRADNAALIRKIENEEYELAKNSVDENALAEKMEVIAQLREEQDECQAEIEALQETNEEINAKLTAARFQVLCRYFFACLIWSLFKETMDAAVQENLELV